MNKKNNKKSIFVINKNATIKEAMEVISLNHKGAVVVVDEKNKVVGVLSDGDIRRALLREASLITPVEKVMNVNYIFYQKGMKETPEEIFKKHIGVTILPVIDKKHKLIDVIIINF